MSQIIDLGKLRFHFAGDWSSEAIYESNDIVKYGGNVYVYTYALKTAGVVPTTTSHWALMVEGFKFRGEFQTATNYRIGDGVAHGGKVYVAVLDSLNQTPPNTTYWQQFADGIQYEGVYSGIKQYQKNDLVTYGASVYIAKSDVIATLPTNTAYWQLFVKGGSFHGTWQEATQYYVGQSVVYGGSQYTALQDNLNANPATSTTNWVLSSPGIQFRGAWSTATSYAKDEIVSYGGNTYISLVPHVQSIFDTDLTATKWQKFNGGIRYRSSWAEGTLYLRDDVVKAGISSYICLEDHTSTANFPADLAVSKWEILTVGAEDVLPTVVSTDIGKSLTILPGGTTYGWQSTTGSANVYYVAPGGIDAPNHGKELATPFASIKYACETAGPGSTIFVKTGTYSEVLPITVPENVAIVGDNQRTTIVQPAAGLSQDGTTPNNQATMFLLSNGSILNKMTFKHMTGAWVPGTTASDIETQTRQSIIVAFNPASPVTTKSPYVLECVAIGGGIIGALVDGSVHASGFKSMNFHGYTIVSDNGVGYYVRQGGKAEIVSCFTYYCYFGYVTSGGGYIRALNGSNSYGTYGATSSGFNEQETPITGTLQGKILSFSGPPTNVSTGDTIVGATSTATGTVISVLTSANKIYYIPVSGTFVQNENVTRQSLAVGTIATGGAINGQNGFLLLVNNLLALPKPGSSISVAGDSTQYVVQSVSGTHIGLQSNILITLAQEKIQVSANGTAVTVRSQYSQIRLTGHDFLDIGTGGVTSTNYPNTPLQAVSQGNEVVENFPGRVYYVSTDQDGNFRVGEYFKIDQGTGRATLNASAFDLSGLTSLRLGSIGAQLGELVNEFSSDTTLGDNSNTAVPTEYAVKSYVDNIVSNKAVNFTISSNTSIAVGTIRTYGSTITISPGVTLTVPSGSFVTFIM